MINNKINLNFKITLRTLDDTYWTIPDPTFNYNVNNYKENFETEAYIKYDDERLLGTTYFYDIVNIIDNQPLITKADKEKLISLVTAGTMDKKNLIYILSNYMLSQKITELEDTIKKGDNPDTSLMEIYKYSKNKNIDYISHNQFKKLDDAIKYLYIPKKKNPQTNIKQDMLYLLKFIKRYPKLGISTVDIAIDDDNNRVMIDANFIDKATTYILTKVNCYKYDISNTYVIPPNQINDIFKNIFSNTPLDNLQNKYDYTIVDEIEKTSTPVYVYKLTDATKEKQKKLLENAKDNISTSSINPLTKEDIEYLNMKETITADTKKDIDGYEYVNIEFNITPEVYKKAYKPNSGVLKNNYIPNNDSTDILSAIVKKIL